MANFMRGPVMVEYSKTYPMPADVTILRFVNTLLQRTIWVCAALGLMLLVLGLGLEEGTLPLESSVKRGWDAFFRMAIGILGLGGVFGLMVVNTVVHDLLMRRIRHVLNGCADDDANRNSVPVQWQRRAIETKAATSPYLGVLGAFGLVLGPILIITGIWFLIERDDFAIESIVAGAAMTAAGWFGIKGFKEASGPAVELWGHRLPKLHPREPHRRYDEDGELQAPTRSELADSEVAKQEIVLAPERMRRLALLDRIADRLGTVSLWAFAVTTLALSLGVFIRQPCQDCTPRTYGEDGEAFIDGLITVATWAMVLALATLVASVLVRGVGHLLLRREVAHLAAQPTSRRPPWYLLREFILEESPLESLTQHLHTVGIASLGVGLSGILAAPHYPFSEWQSVFQMLVALGASLLVLYAASWFWNRGTTAQQGELLRDRWED